MSEDYTYVTSPLGSDFTSKNSEVLDVAKAQSTLSHRLLSALGENKEDNGPNGFKFFEANLVSTKSVSFKESDISMLDPTFLASNKGRVGLEYNVIRFNRKHNIRSFDFIISYTQLTSFGSDMYKPTPITKQFKGTFLFSGCSNIKDKDTYEYLPFKLSARYESIGDMPGEDVSIDGLGNMKGGPALTFKYSKTDEYVYLFIYSVAPFRLVPLGGGSFADISLVENQGSFSGEQKPSRIVISDPTTGATTTKVFARDPYIYCDISISIRDTTVANSNSNLEVVPIMKAITSANSATIETNATLLTIAPTHNGEISTVGFSPVAYENLEIASVVSPISFGSRLLSSNIADVAAISEKVKTLIKNAAINVGKIPFTIKESIRVRGLYNIKGDYLIDNAADSFGKILITEVGTYDAVADTFDIVSYIFDLENGKDKTTVGAIKSFFGNVSDYLSSLTAGATHTPTTKTTDPLSIVKSISFDSSYDISKFQDIAYISSNLTTLVERAFVEISSGSINDEDVVVYIGADNCIKVCSFKDYDMSSVASTYLFSTLSTALKNVVSVTSIERYTNNGLYVYIIGTNLGLVFRITLGDSNTPTISIGENPFIERLDFETRTVVGNEAVTGIFEVGNYLYFVGDAGSVSLYDKVNSKYILLPKYAFDSAFGGEEIEYIVDGSGFILFKTASYVKAYSLTKKEWSSDLSSDVGPHIDMRTPFYGAGKEIVNLQFGDGCLGDVPIIQRGDYVYAMGVRSSDNLPMYRKLNIVTGEVTRLDIPSVGNQIIKAKLVFMGNYIISVGGTPVDYSAAVTSDLVTYLSVFDTLSETWISSSTLNLNLENTSFEGSQVYRKFEEFYPIVLGNTIHIVKPKVRYLTTDANTGVLSQAYTYEAGRYEIVFASDFSTVTYSYHAFAVNTEFTEFAEALATYHPIRAVGTTLFGLFMLKSQGNTGYPVPNGEVRYDLYEVVIDTADTGNSYANGGAIMGIDRDVIVSEYAGYAENAPTDGLADAVVYRINDSKFVIYLLTKVIMVVDLGGFSYDAYTLHYALASLTVKSLISDYDYTTVWAGGSKTPANTQFIRKGEYLAFVGGTAYPTPDYFSLDTHSFIRTPRDVGRNSGTDTSPVDITGAIRELVGPDYAFSSMSSVTVGNAMYIVATVAYLPEYKDDILLTGGYASSPSMDRVLLLKYEADRSGKLEMYDDLTSYFTDAMSSVCFPEYIELFELGGSLFMYAKRLRTNDQATSILTPTRTIIRYIPATKVGTYVSSTVKVGFDSFVITSPLKSEAYIVDVSTPVDYPYLNGAAGICAVAKLKLYSDSTVTLTTLTNVMRNIVESSDYVGISSYKVAATFGQYAFIATIRALYIVDVLALEGDALLSVGAGITKVFDFGKDEILRSITVSGDWVYVTGGFAGGVNGADRLLPDTSVFKFHAPTIIQNIGTIARPTEFIMPRPAIKYHNAFMVTKDETMVTVGDIVNPHVTSSLSTFDPMTCILSSALFEMDVSKVGYTPSAYTIPIDTIPKTTLNLYQPRTMLAHFDQGDVLFVLGGRVSSNSDYGITVDGYDVSKRMWFTGPSLPVALKNIVFQDNMIVGATEILESGIEQAYNAVLKITCSDFDDHTFAWEKETFSLTANTGAANTVTIASKSRYARHHASDGSVITSYIIALAETGVISKGSASSAILRNVVSGASISWAAIADIPYSEGYSYYVLHADVDEYGRFIVYLLNTVLKTVYVWVYANESWSLDSRSFVDDAFSAIANISVTAFEYSKSTKLPAIFARTYLTYTGSNGIATALVCDTTESSGVLVEKVPLASLSDAGVTLDSVEYTLSKNGNIFIRHNLTMSTMEYIPIDVSPMTFAGIRNRIHNTQTISPIPFKNERRMVTGSGISKTIDALLFVSSVHVNDTIVSLVADNGYLYYLVYDIYADAYSSLIPLTYTDGTTLCPYAADDEITLAYFGSHLFGIPTTFPAARTAIVPGVIVTDIPTMKSVSVTFSAGSNLVFANPAAATSYGKIRVAVSVFGGKCTLFFSRDMLTAEGSTIYPCSYKDLTEASLSDSTKTINATFEIYTSYGYLGNSDVILDHVTCGYSDNTYDSYQFASLATVKSAGSGGKYGLLSLFNGGELGLRSQMVVPLPADNVSLVKSGNTLYIVPSTLNSVDYPVLAVDLSGPIGLSPVRYVGYAEYGKASRCRVGSTNSNSWVSGNDVLYNVSMGSKFQVRPVKENPFALSSNKNSAYASFENNLFEIVYDGSNYTLRTFNRETFEKTASVLMSVATGVTFALDFINDIVVASSDGTKIVVIAGSYKSYVVDVTSGYVSGNTGKGGNTTGIMPYLKTYAITKSKEYAYLINPATLQVCKVTLSSGSISNMTTYSGFEITAILGLIDDTHMLVYGKPTASSGVGVYTASIDIDAGDVDLIGLENTNVLFTEAVLGVVEGVDNLYVYTKTGTCAVSIYTKHGAHVRTSSIDSVFGNSNIAKFYVLPAYERLPTIVAPVSELSDTYLSLVSATEAADVVSDSFIPINMSCASRNVFGVKRISADTALNSYNRKIGNTVLSSVSGASPASRLEHVLVHGKFPGDIIRNSGDKSIFAVAYGRYTVHCFKSASTYFLMLVDTLGTKYSAKSIALTADQATSLGLANRTNPVAISIETAPVKSGDVWYEGCIYLVGSDTLDYATHSSTGSAPADSIVQIAFAHANPELDISTDEVTLVISTVAILDNGVNKGFLSAKAIKTSDNRALVLSGLASASTFNTTITVLKATSTSATVGGLPSSYSYTPVFGSLSNAVVGIDSIFKIANIVFAVCTEFAPNVLSSRTYKRALYYGEIDSAGIVTTFTKWTEKSLTSHVFDSDMVALNQNIARPTKVVDYGSLIELDLPLISSGFKDTYIDTSAVSSLPSSVSASTVADIIDLLTSSLTLRYEGSDDVSMINVPCGAKRMYLEKSSFVTTPSNLGTITAFTKKVEDNELIKDIASYYDGTYEVLISSKNVIYIRVDGTVYTYSLDDTSISFPFTSDILPIVATFGSRTNSSGATEARYYAFIDVNGNVSTFDRSTRTFVNIDGTVEVDIPYMSAELMIYPSKAVKEGSIGKRIWAFSASNPYSTASTDDKLTVDDSTLL